MRLIYVHMQDNYVLMRLIYVKMQDNYVAVWFLLCQHKNNYNVDMQMTFFLLLWRMSFQFRFLYLLTWHYLSLHIKIHNYFDEIWRNCSRFRKRLPAPPSLSDWNFQNDINTFSGVVERDRSAELFETLSRYYYLLWSPVHVLTTLAVA
jgi:hypothetical protein